MAADIHHEEVVKSEGKTAWSAEAEPVKGVRAYEWWAVKNCRL